MPPMLMPAQLDHLTAEELRQLVQGLTLHVTRQDQLISQKDQELHWRQSKIDKLTHELALHKRWRFGVKAERLRGSFGRHGGRRRLHEGGEGQQLPGPGHHCILRR